MTNTAYTRGPWEYTLDAKGVCGVHGADNAKVPVRIAEVTADTQKRAEANVALIASAPAQAMLLDLVRYGLLSLGDIDCEFDEVVYGFDPEQPDWRALIDAIGWDTAYAAIAKAAGISPAPAADDPLTGEARAYSVLLLYPDYIDDTGHETYYAFVTAADPIAAIIEAQRQAADDEEPEINDPNDFIPLLVIEGHRRSEPLFNR